MKILSRSTGVLLASVTQVLSEAPWKIAGGWLHYADVLVGRVAGSVTRPKNTFTNLRHVKSGVSSIFSWSRRLFDGCFCRVATTLHVHRAPMLCWLATSSPPTRLRPRAHVPIRTTERLMLQWVRETTNTGTWECTLVVMPPPRRGLAIVSSQSRKL